MEKDIMKVMDTVRKVEWRRDIESQSVYERSHKVCRRKVEI